MTIVHSSQADYKDCSLTGRTNAEFQQMMSAADGEEQVHIATHHVFYQHGHLDPNVLEFFRERKLPLMDVAASVESAVYEACVKGLYPLAHALKPVKPITELTEEIDMHELVDHLAKEHGESASFGFICGAITATYLGSGGEYCLWGLIDPQLCKD